MILKIKKGFMKYVWRLQQSQMIVGVIFWSLTLSGIFFPYFKPHFVNLGLISSSQVAIGLFILFLVVLIIILMIGYVYDKVFKMWAEQRIVAIERNIFFHTKQNAKEIVHWQYYHIPLHTALDLKAEAEFLNKWNERCMEEDKILRGDVYSIARWSNECKLKPKKDRWLRNVKEYFSPRTDWMRRFLNCSHRRQIPCFCHDGLSSRQSGSKVHTADTAVCPARPERIYPEVSVPPIKPG